MALDLFKYITAPITVLYCTVLYCTVLYYNVLYCTFRCDGKMDCSDGTDEEECKAIVRSLGYNKLLEPPSIKKGERSSLGWEIDIQEIVDIDEIQNVIQIKFQYKRMWFDSHLTYQNLIDKADNVISSSDRKTIWSPWIIFQNIVGFDKIFRTDVPDVSRVVLNPNFTFMTGDNENLHNIHLFKGSENQIEDERERRVEWLCHFHMEWYPFDTQSCTMQFRITYHSIDFVPLNVTYSGPIELPQHHVHDVKMCSATIEGDQGIIVEVILGRPIFSSFLTTTLPTVMLIIISQLATTFSREYLDMVIQVNLTVLLVLATL